MCIRDRGYISDLENERELELFKLSRDHKELIKRVERIKNSAELEANTGHQHGRQPTTAKEQHRPTLREVQFYHLSLLF